MATRPPTVQHSFHALLLPLPAQGHINPLLHFAHRLLLLRPQHPSASTPPTATITFVNTERNHHRLLAQHSSTISSTTSIRFVSIPDGLPPDAPSLDTSIKTLRMVLDGVKKQEGLLEEIISASTSTKCPISCIISDAFFPWTQDLANRMGIARVYFWTGNATTLYLNELIATGKLQLGERDSSQLIEGSDQLSALSLVHNEIVPSFLASHSPEGFKFVKALFQGIQDTACIVVNTCHKLEGAILEAMPLDVPVRYVGPLLSLPTLCKQQQQPSSDANYGGSLFDEETECLPWLDTQEIASVLYISFGSLAALPLTQLEQLALGIEISRQPFLWVIRFDTRSGQTQQLLEAFVHKTRDRGLIISWAPQLCVLGHPAVGGFLTHCGWNSTLESIAMGVPMLCWPIFAEQPINATLVEMLWKVGMGFQKAEGGLVEKEEVERVVIAVLKGKEGEEVRQRAVELREATRKAVCEKDGLADGELEAFLGDVFKKSPQGGRMGLDLHEMAD